MQSQSQFQAEKESAPMKRHFESEMPDPVHGLLLVTLDIIIIMSNLAQSRRMWIQRRSDNATVRRSKRRQALSGRFDEVNALRIKAAVNDGRTKFRRGII